MSYFFSLLASFLPSPECGFRTLVRELQIPPPIFTFPFFITLGEVGAQLWNTIRSWLIGSQPELWLLPELSQPIIILKCLTGDCLPTPCWALWRNQNSLKGAGKCQLGRRLFSHLMEVELSDTRRYPARMPCCFYQLLPCIFLMWRHYPHFIVKTRKGEKKQW